MHFVGSAERLGLLRSRVLSCTLSGAVLWVLSTIGCNEKPTSPCTGVTRFLIAPGDTAIILGTSLIASLTRFVCGESVSLGESVTWRSENAVIAEVDSVGRIRGNTVGATHIVATGARSGLLGGLDLFVYNPTNPTDVEARTELWHYIEQITKAAGRRYGVHDDAGHTMDGLKIIANPTAGGFIGVYQTYNNGGTFDAHLATSTDLLNWHWRVRLAALAAQPTIKAAGSGFVVALETDGDNHLRFAYYDSWSSLLSAVPSKTYDATRTLSPCAEGTPNIYAGDAARVEVGFHYWSDCNVGRQARGVTDWTSWSATREIGLDSAITRYGIAGVGDRDCMLSFRGYEFCLIEGEGVRGDWTSWRIFLYDYQTGTADSLNIQTDAGSISFGNPTIEQVQISGQATLVTTLYLFLDGARGGETASLVYYRPYP